MQLAAAPREANGARAIRNPYTRETVGWVADCSPADVERALVSASSYDGHLTADRRARLLARLADALECEKPRFQALITDEAGLCVRDAAVEVERSIANLRLAAAETQRLDGEALRYTKGGADKMALTLYEPVGVIAVITPFNRPLNQVVVKVAPAVAANNAVVLKPSEKTPLSALAFAELFASVGFPPEMLSLVTGDPQQVGEALVTSPLVDMVAFTGSVRVGESVAQRAGMKKLLLELGGNDPLFVLEDADLALAAKLAADGALATAGQACRAVKRIIVMDSVADAFAHALVETVARKRWGDPYDPATEVGPLIDEAAAIEVERRCNAAVDDGAWLLHGGRRDGALLQPIVLDHVDSSSMLVAQETFGPVAPIIRVGSLDEALAVANGTPYGLQAGVVTRDATAFLRIARELRVGGVALLDGPNFDSPFIPFGGVKKSGLGREGVRFAMREMSVLKTVVVPWSGMFASTPSPTG
jgi:putative phosphonoacetaldehyde dehydrogenase